jgi:hypothetical protein
MRKSERLKKLYKVGITHFFPQTFFILILCANGDFTEGKPIPTELRNEEAELRHQIDLEDENTASMLFFIYFLFFYFLFL